MLVVISGSIMLNMVVLMLLSICIGMSRYGLLMFVNSSVCIGSVEKLSSRIGWCF